jgi:hypothetical protein
MVSWINGLSDHTSCMKQLQKAGIYVISNLAQPLTQLSVSQTWDHSAQDQFRTILDSIENFPNLLAIFVGSSPITLPFVKAVVRDMKEYMVIRNYRNIPIGAFFRIAHGRSPQQYLSCGEQNSCIDFLGIRSYRGCSDLQLKRQEYENATISYSDSSIPVVLLDESCNPQIELLQSISGSGLAGILSGAIIFSYFGSTRNDQAGNQTCRFQ